MSLPEDAPTSRERRLAAKDPVGLLGPGTMQWNAAGFFGSQLGATLWIGLLGGVLLGTSVAGGLGVLALCLVANLVGYGLWRRRAHLAPHLAIQLLCLTSLSAAAGAMLIIHALGLSELVVSETSSGWPLWAYLLVYPVLMVGLWWLDRAGTERQA